MFKRLSTGPRALPTRLLLVLALTCGVAWLASLYFRGTAPAADKPVGLEAEAPAADIAPRAAPRKLEGEGARAYLERTSEGQSLMKALEAARFGLKREEHSPFDKKSGAGYLAMSHDQNLNAWFGEEGATIRPTVSEKERDKAWRLGFSLKSYGYGDQLKAAPPVLSSNVRDNRIEYTRDDSTNPQSEFRNPQLVEWYENQSAGIEQGFTLSARPERGGDVGVYEPLRLVVGVTGDLRARAKDEGEAIELSKNGQSVLSYSKLTALDANGKKLAARMEPSADGREIALVIEDRDAVYPLVIDPITASLEREFDGNQVDSRFGFAVAIDGDKAVVGAWRQDTISIIGIPIPDAGVVYIFSRSGSTWSQVQTFSGSSSNATWGYSVAVSNNRVVFGCPGMQTQRGAAFLYDISAITVKEITQIERSLAAGDQFGYSVAISGTDIVVSAPFVDDSASVPDTGRVYTFIANSDGTVSFERNTISDNVAGANSQLGAAVAIDGLNIILGEPGAGAGQAQIWTLNPVNRFLGTRTRIQASDGEAGDQFGNSVDIDGNTAVVGAYGDDDRGTDAGAAYVFVGNTSGQWNQQQKLTFNGSRANDHFSQHAVAIEGNTIVVGADEWDFFPDDNAGAVYIYTRSGTVWTRQTELQGASAYNYGIGVDLSGNSVIIGARGADAPGITRAGTAYVYRLDCTAPYSGKTAITNFNTGLPQSSFCPGASVLVSGGYSGGTGSPVTFQWRKNGVNIPGATFDRYFINSVSASDEGIYDLVVTNSCGSEISSPSTLTVHSFSLNPTSQNFSASGSNGIVNVTSTGSCGWTAASNAPWITITSGASGTVPGTVGFTVAANTGAAQRTGTLTIAGQTFTVTQDGLNCSYSIAPTSQSFGASGGSNSVGVTATAGCAWTATSNASWITVPLGAGGTGNGTLNYTVAANTGPQRTGTITVAGQTFTVTQSSGCTFSINPTAQSFNASGGAASVTVTAGGGCDWTAQSNSPSFITITSGASGSGSGTVSYSVSANSSTTPRSGTLTIAGQTFTVTQGGAAPPAQTVQLSQSSYTVSEGALFATITVTRSGDTSQAATVKYQTSDSTDVNFRCDPNTSGQITGQASRKCDYHIASGRLRFGAGESSKSIVLSLVNDVYVEGNETFTLSLSGPTGFTLGTPSSATITITDDDLGGAANPVDNTRFFVRQLYVDLLSREPDQAGWDGWVHRIDFCGQPGEPPPPCDRVTVGGDGFLRSSEFFDRQFFVLRLYKTAFGRILQYSEVGDLAFVSGFLSSADLELNKQELVAEMMTRAEFTTKYGSLGDQSFVDTLLQTAGVTLSSADRNALITSLGANTKTRAQVFREISERPEVSAKHLTESQVVSAYYGFFTRNPDGAYFNYLQRLNSGEINLGDLANAFINAAEYRQRFGP